MSFTSLPKLFITAVAALLVPATAGAQAQGTSNDAGLGPVLANIKKTRTVHVGYRDASPPFSFLDQAGRPIGYSLELCEAIVDQIGTEVDEPGNTPDAGPKVGLKIEYVKVTAESRIAMVAEHRIDLECGSTTANFERAKQVAFSPLIYVAGTKLLVAKDSRISSFRDLSAKTVVVTRGTTNEKALQVLDLRYNLGLKFMTGADHEESYQMLVAKKADAFATDDVLLYGLVARHKSQDQLRVVGDYLSYEPYGVMYPKDDPSLRPVIERTFRQLAVNHDLQPIYDKWFIARLPTGERLNIPISPQLEDSFNALGGASSSGN